MMIARRPSCGNASLPSWSGEVVDQSFCCDGERPAADGSETVWTDLVDNFRRWASTIFLATFKDTARGLATGVASEGSLLPVGSHPVSIMRGPRYIYQDEIWFWLPYRLRIAVEAHLAHLLGLLPALFEG